MSGNFRQSFIDVSGILPDFEQLIAVRGEEIKSALARSLSKQKAMKFYIIVDVELQRETPDGTQHTTARFRSPLQCIGDIAELDLDTINAALAQQLEDFNENGSGWELAAITSCEIRTAKHRPLVGSCYIKTPTTIRNKRATVNVRNRDNKCFLYAVAAALYCSNPKNPNHPLQYLPYIARFRYDGLNFPLAVKDVEKFEALNEISVNVLYWDEDEKDFYNLHCTKFRYPKCANLLLLAEEDKWHYVAIRDLSRLCAGRSCHDGRTYVCSYCLHPFATQSSLDNHSSLCSSNPPQVVRYPDSDECVLEWKATSRCHPVPVVIYADFECFIKKTGDEIKVAAHIPSGVCCLTVWQDDKHNDRPPFIYTGPDVMTHFYDHLITEHRRIAAVLNVNTSMTALTVVEQTTFDEAVECYFCGSAFSADNKKTAHHDHVTGDYVAPACNNCNLQLKPRKRAEDDYFVPVILHNLKNYDANLILKHFQRRLVKAENDYRDLSVIAKNSERYVSFEINCYRFIDSYQFMASALEELVSTLSKAGDDNFQFTKRWLSDDPIVLKKGVYPYEYMNDAQRLEETSLPPINCFYSQLNEESISEEEYHRAKTVWNKFNCQTMRDYHDLYLKSDVVLLADVFENFRTLFRECYGLDPCHYRTLAGFCWDALLKESRAKLDLLTDPNMYLLMERGIRGGISVISNRYAKANNKYLPDYDNQKPSSYIWYVDCNNLYGGAMRCSLPVGEFRWLSSEEIEHFDINQVADDGERGYVLVVDLAYPEALHKLHSDYPLAPEKKTITKDMLSGYSKSIFDGRRATEKLVPNLYDKEDYIVHYRLLKFYIQHGLIIKKVTKVLSFRQAPWMQGYIDANTVRRQAALSEFVSTLYKLANNIVFGKSMENVRLRVNMNLVSSETRALKLVAKPHFKRFEIINKELVLIEMLRSRLLLNKPIYTGFTVLELSKLFMFQYHYGFIIPKYGENAKLLFTDTDSLCYHIECDDLYEDLKNHTDLHDFSSYPQNHPLHSMTNKKVVLKFKDECNGRPPVEFVGLRSKMYSLLVDPDRPAKSKAKGVKRKYVDKHVRHEMFRDVLFSKDQTRASFHTIRAYNHELFTVKQDKLALSSFDDKRYVLTNGCDTLAHGHCKIRLIEN